MPPNSSSNSIEITREKLLSELNYRSDDFATKFSDRLFQTAIDCKASDLHLDATASGLEVRMRADGVLVELVRIPLANSTQVIARIKSISGLLSYKTDVPQEGRIHFPLNGSDARVCTMPTLHGERIAIRFSISQSCKWLLSDLGLETELINRIQNAIAAASGVILIAGPAGAGKTTTAYAMMQQLAKAETTLRRSLVSLEDPIEQALEGVSQSQIQPSVGYTWNSGLKAVLRQDPEVMLIGEIRDAETAHIAFQAAMSGQLVITTMHARSVADALTRLIDMQVPIHQLASALSLLLAQRLLRVNSIVDGSQSSRNRQLIVESLPPIELALRKAILDGAGIQSIHDAALAQGLEPLQVQAQKLLDQGMIDELTFRRHFERQRNEL